MSDVSLRRKYSVAEIDAMRRAISWSYPSGGPFYAAERAAEIEQRLQTYMMNGTDPAELEDVANARLCAELKRSSSPT